MKQDEDGFLNHPSNQILFNLKQREKSVFPLPKWKPAFEIQMVFYDPITMGKQGLSEKIFVTDSQGRFKAWV